MEVKETVEKPDLVSLFTAGQVFLCFHKILISDSWYLT
jgi:hypothetical protein